MTPTAQIAAIRQIATEDRNLALALWSEAWDTHQSALRALVAQWRESADLAHPDATAARAAVHTCADQLARYLESEP